jgi:hypothetical protein
MRQSRPFSVDLTTSYFSPISCFCMSGAELELLLSAGKEDSMVKEKNRIIRYVRYIPYRNR